MFSSFLHLLQGVQPPNMDEVHTGQPVQGRAGGRGHQQSQVGAHASLYSTVFKLQQKVHYLL